MQNTNLKKVGLSVMIVMVVVGFGSIIGFGSPQDGLINKNTPGKTVEVPVELPVDVLDELKEYMNGPYLFTPHGGVKIAGISEPPPKKLTNLLDGKGDLKVEGMQVGSDKVNQYVSKKYGESGENLEISGD